MYWLKYYLTYINSIYIYIIIINGTHGCLWGGYYNETNKIILINTVIDKYK